jgi:hypothetical protein
VKIKYNIRYLIIFISALVIEICSTFYIRFVSEGNATGMIFFAAISPFLGLPFLGYMIEATNWSERISNAVALSAGYITGTVIVITLIK